MIKKIVNIIFLTFLSGLIIWLFASIVDVNLHNNPNTENYKNYSDWNLFINLNDFIN